MEKKRCATALFTISTLYLFRKFLVEIYDNKILTKLLERCLFDTDRVGIMDKKKFINVFFSRNENFSWVRLLYPFSHRGYMEDKLLLFIDIKRRSGYKSLEKFERESIIREVREMKEENEEKGEGGNKVLIEHVTKTFLDLSEDYEGSLMSKIVDLQNEIVSIIKPYVCNILGNIIQKIF